MAGKTIDEMTEETALLCRFYGKLRQIFIEQGYASLAEQELRHYAAECIARLQVENAELKRRAEKQKVAYTGLEDEILRQHDEIEAFCDYINHMPDGCDNCPETEGTCYEPRSVAHIIHEQRKAEFIIMCAWCGKVKEQDIWIVDPGNSGAKITHTICPECFELEKDEAYMKAQEAKGE